MIFNLDEAKRIEEENEVEQETSTSTNTKTTKDFTKTKTRLVEDEDTMRRPCFCLVCSTLVVSGVVSSNYCGGECVR